MKNQKKITITLATACLCLATAFGASGLSLQKVSGASGEKLSDRWVADPGIDTTVDTSKGEFSVVFMGDQQIAVGNDKKYVESTYDYLAEKKEELNLKMFINLGDIMDVVDFCDFVGGYNTYGDRDTNGPNRGEDPTCAYWYQQREFVGEQVQKLEDADIPVALVMGNHDYEDMAYNYRINKTFDEVFPLSRFENYEYFGGSQFEDIEQAYYYFDAPNGDKYMTLILGLFPDDNMIAWANKVIEENSDRKVIIATHAYFKVQNMEKRAEKLWDECISLHENIIMTVCGHSSVDDSFARQVDFGVHGNPVYQFMINSQNAEFGGAGVIAQFIFRDNGNKVDVVHYAPAVEEYADELITKEGQGMYFFEKCQFPMTMNLEKISVDTTGETVVGNLFDGEIFDINYASFSADSDKWLQNVYAYKNVKVITGKGLATNGTGYITYKLDAGEIARFNEMSYYALGKLVPSSNGISAYQLDVSLDGERYITAGYNNVETGKFGVPIDVSEDIRGAKQLYVRILLCGEEDSYLNYFHAEISKVKTVFTGENYTLDYDFTSSAINVDNFSQGTYKHLDARIDNRRGQVLATGKDGGYIGGKAYLQYRFDSLDGNAYEDFDFYALMRVDEITEYVFTKNDHHTSTKMNWWFKDPDCSFALRLWISYDGKNFEKITSWERDENIGENVEFTYDLGSYVADKTSFVIKVEFFGADWDDVAIKKLSFGVKQTENVQPELPEEKVEHTYTLNGGTIVNGIPVKTGYVFGGWFISETLDGEAVNPEDYTTATIFYAKWLKNYSITYILDGGKNAQSNKAVLAEGETLTLADAEKEGMEFLGWYDKDGNEVRELTAGENLVVYALFNAPQTEKSGGCSGSISLCGGLGVLLGTAFLLCKKKRN